MPSRAGAASAAARAAAALAVLTTLTALSACGGSSSDGGASASLAAPTKTPVACANAVLTSLRGVARRIYREGVSSERTASASHIVRASRALSRAVETGDRAAALAAAKELIATGHMVNLTVLREGHVLARAGEPRALSPLRGTIHGASGAPVGSYVTSVWADMGLIEETTGVTGAETVIRRDRRAIAGKFQLPGARMPARGTLTVGGIEYAYTSLPAAEFPSGAHLRVYLVRSLSSTRALCGANVEETTVKTLAKVARQLYLGEGGSRAQVEVRRVQHNQALVGAVAARESEATRTAIDALLTEHIVRLRVSAGGRLISDVGGPYVLAPVRAALRSGGRTIGQFVLSIQDDEGYLRLARRLAGLSVLMYMGPQLVKNSLGPDPGNAPEEGAYTYRGRRFRTVTVHAEAFPSGPLRIIVLIPIPYT